MSNISIYSGLDGWEQTADSSMVVNYFDGTNHFHRFGYIAAYGQCSSNYRFDLNIPRGSTITSATITLTRVLTRAFTTETTIYGVDEDNPTDPVNGSYATRYLARSLTSATVSWTFPAGSANASSTSGDISSIIQEIIDRPSWQSGNRIGIVIQGPASGGDSTQYTYGTRQVTPAYRPTLSVTFTAPAGWLSAWRYRKSITLSRASGAVTNYQMRLLVGQAAGEGAADVFGDTFNRANGALGDNWTAISTMTPVIYNNAIAKSSGSAGTGVSVWSADSFSANQWVTGQAIATVNADGSLVLRGDTSTHTHYLIYMQQVNHSVHVYVNTSGVDGAYILLGLSGSNKWAANDYIRGEIIGGRITVYNAGADGTGRTVIMAVNDSQLTSGNPGVGSSSNTTSLVMDNVSGGNITTVGDVSCEGNCNDDFSDLRFTAPENDIVLDYYIEDISGTSGNYVASVWIEFNSIGTSDTSFYMYYGNTAAPAVSNGVNTFILFDDFNSLNTADLTGQNNWSGNTNWDVAATTVYEGAKSAQSAAAATSYIDKAIVSGTVAWQLFLQVRMRHSNVTITNGLDVYLFEGAATQISAIAISASQFKALASTTIWTDIGKAPANNTWYKATLAIDATTTHKTWIDEGQYAPASQGNYNNVSSTIDKIRVEQYTTGGTALVDQIIIGYYLPTGPAWGSWGSQEAIERSQSIFIM